LEPNGLVATSTEIDVAANVVRVDVVFVEESEARRIEALQPGLALKSFLVAEH
jgi:hypothetical protein